VARILPHLRRVLVVGYSPVCRDRFVAKTRRRISLLIKAADSEAAACSPNVLVTATGSSKPVFVEA
jgi:ornithine cyclodeaminase/alanine dehydrogenase-like protein (mu-crystallin family)